VDLPEYNLLSNMALLAAGYRAILQNAKFGISSHLDDGAALLSHLEAVCCASVTVTSVFREGTTCCFGTVFATESK